MDIGTGKTTATNCKLGAFQRVSVSVLVFFRPEMLHFTLIVLIVLYENKTCVVLR